MVRAGPADRPGAGRVANDNPRSGGFANVASATYPPHMVIISHGIDLVDCRRIGELLERHRERFLERMFTAAERERIDRLRDAVPHIAGRFAAKEAILKVLGTGWRGAIAWTDMEITNDVAGAPHVMLSGECARIAQGRGIAHVLLSISHTETHAMASALGVQ